MSNITVDNLTPERHLIDLTKYTDNDIGIDDYVLDKVMGDIILVEFADLTSDGRDVIRNGIVVPVNTLTNAWRKGKVVLKGPLVKYTEIGEIVLFPNNVGIRVSGIEVNNFGKIKDGLFLNEERMFGTCHKNESTPVTAGIAIA